MVFTSARRFPKRFALGVLGTLLLVPVTTKAGGPPPGVPSGMPWEAARYQGYHAPAHAETPGPQHPTFHNPLHAEHYTLHVSILPQHHEYPDRDTGLVIAHLPEDALIYFQDQPTHQTGSLREFITPTVDPGHKFTYAVKVRWHEKGNWVEQMHSFAIRGGEVHCIDIVPSTSTTTSKLVEMNLGKLSRYDGEAAEQQTFCALQNGIRLGSMGIPVKISLNGKDVFLCCASCVEAARKEPEKTLAAAEKLKSRIVVLPK